MPIYEYQCADCSTTFEKLTTLSEAHTTQKCPSCESTSGKRILSAHAVGASSASGGFPSAAMPPSCGGCPGGGCPMN